MSCRDDGNMGSRRVPKEKRTTTQPRRRQQPRTTVVVWAARLRGLVRVSSSGGPSFWRQAEVNMGEMQMSGFPTFPGGGQNAELLNSTCNLYLYQCMCLYLSSCPNKNYLLRQARRPAFILAKQSLVPLFLVRFCWRGDLEGKDFDAPATRCFVRTRHLRVHFS